MKTQKEKKTNDYLLTEDELSYLVALNASESFKRNFRKLLEHFGTFKRVYHAGQTELKGVSGICSRTIDSIMRIRQSFKPGYGMERIANKNVRIVTWWDSDYPSMLRNIADPPPLLYVKGDLNYEYELSIAIVGTRRATSHGVQQARHFAKELSRIGFTIISGGASGIDAEAHKGALEENGKTFAVFGSGIDVYFPAGHMQLFKDIAKAGALLTEFPPGTMPESYRFPVRNRIISGLSRGVLIVQAPEKSGALITAEYAMEQGRELMAIPGRNDNPYCLGTNLLIRDGAKMVLEPMDVPAIYNLIVERTERTSKPVSNLDSVSKRILECIGWEPCQMDEIVRHTNISVSEVSSKLLEMMMNGYVKELPGKRYVRIAT